VGDDLTVALNVDRHDLGLAPVAEPQPILVPARGLADHEIAQQHLRLRRHQTS
jgi:hypothetical protein